MMEAEGHTEPPSGPLNGDESPGTVPINDPATSAMQGHLLNTPDGPAVAPHARAEGKRLLHEAVHPAFVYITL
jgi:hypothetical protein